MAIVWVDGFEGYTAATDLTARGYSFNGASTGYLVNQTPRIAGNGAALLINDNFSLYTPNNILNTPTVITGFAMKFDDANNQNVGAGNLIIFRNGSSIQMTVQWLTGGVFRVLRGGAFLSGTEGTINVVPSNGIWMWVECKVTISSTVGTCEVKVNGVSVLNLTGLNNQGVGGNSNITNVALSGDNYFTYFDDWYIADTSGSYNNDYLGSIKVITSNPIANGSTNNFTAVGAASNYLCVDEAALANGNTDYVESSTAGHFDLYDVTSISTGITNAPAVWIECNAQKTIAGAREIKLLARSSGNDAISGVQSLTQSVYNYYSYVADKDPNGSITWTGTNINAAEFGVKLET